MEAEYSLNTGQSSREPDRNDHTVSPIFSTPGSLLVVYGSTYSLANSNQRSKIKLAQSFNFARGTPMISSKSGVLVYESPGQKGTKRSQKGQGLSWRTLWL